MIFSFTVDIQTCNVPWKDKVKDIWLNKTHSFCSTCIKPLHSASIGHVSAGFLLWVPLICAMKLSSRRGVEVLLICLVVTRLGSHGLFLSAGETWWDMVRRGETWWDVVRLEHSRWLIWSRDRLGSSASSSFDQVSGDVIASAVVPSETTWVYVLNSRK